MAWLTLVSHVQPIIPHPGSCPTCRLFLLSIDIYMYVQLVSAGWDGGTPFIYLACALDNRIKS